MIANTKSQILVTASPEAVFEAMTDWDNQSKWMIGTTVKSGKFDGCAVGGTIEAFSGIGKFGVRDNMTITVWDPPYRCSVEHTGKLIRGHGDFTAKPQLNNQVMFEWSEQLEIPYGLLGRIGWVITKPIFLFSIKVSLNRFAKNLNHVG